MPEKDTDGLLPNREHYGELARQVREVARLTRHPFARKSYSALLTAFSTARAILAGTRTRSDGRYIVEHPLRTQFWTQTLRYRAKRSELRWEHSSR
jgi:hypothetical protein